MGGGAVEEGADGADRARGEVVVGVVSSDFDVKAYIERFNSEHKGKINLLDFSNYSTKFNDFKDNPISQQDMETIREFQKRKIDQKLHYLNKGRFKSNSPPTQGTPTTRSSTRRTSRRTSLPPTRKSRWAGLRSPRPGTSECRPPGAGSTSRTTS